MQRYFVDNKDINKIFTLNSDDSHHITNVMRMHIQDTIEIVNNTNVYLCEIIELSSNVKAKIINNITINNELPCHVTMAQGLVNEQKMDFILQKTCELGINEIIPLALSRSVVKIGTKESKKINRWNKILKEASEQSKRCTIPKINNVMKVDELISLEYDYKLLCSVNEMTTGIKKVLDELENGAKILFVIGPEGGFTPEEEKKLINTGFTSVSLGKRVLRSETAGMYVMSIINYILME